MGKQEIKSEVKTVRKTDAEILEIDFYDLLGSFASFYTDDEKIMYYKELFGYPTK